jgi:hypothetical protein
MGLLNSKKPAPLHTPYEWGGTVARINRGAQSSRSGRRSALLGMITSVYANNTRGRSTGSDTRGSSDRG